MGKGKKKEQSLYAGNADDQQHEHHKAAQRKHAVEQVDAEQQPPRRAAEGSRFAQNERGSKEDERHEQKAAGCRSFGKAGPQHQQNQQSRQQKIQCTAGKQEAKGASSHKAQPLSFLRAACCGFAKTLV